MIWQIKYFVLMLLFCFHSLPSLWHDKIKNYVVNNISMKSYIVLAWYSLFPCSQNNQWINHEGKLLICRLGFCCVQAAETIGRHFPDNILKRIFFHENVWIPIKISLKFVPKGPVNNIPALVQKMAYIIQWLLDYRCIYESLRLNMLTHWVLWDWIV